MTSEASVSVNDEDKAESHTEVKEEEPKSKIATSEPVEAKPVSDSTNDQTESTNTDPGAVVDSSSTKNEAEESQLTQASAEPESGMGDGNQTLVVPDNEEVRSKMSAPIPEAQAPMLTSVDAESHVTVEAANQIEEPSAPSYMTSTLTDTFVEPSAPSLKLTNQIAEPSAPALIDFTERVELVRCEGVESVEHVRGVTTSVTSVTSVERVQYPRLDSFLQGAHTHTHTHTHSYTAHTHTHTHTHTPHTEEECEDELTPFSEEDLAILYPNRQLDTNSLFVDNFLQVSHQRMSQICSTQT